MKRILLGIYMIVVVLSVWAVPARSSFFKVSQPDGSVLVVRSFGDEHFHGLVTEEGVVIARDSATGWYLPVDSAILEARRCGALVKKQLINQHRMARLASARRLSQTTKSHDIGERCSFEGKKYGLVILVNFKDKEFVRSTQAFDSLFNTKGYAENGHIGSVKDYFYDQSYGKLEIDFDVVGPVTVSREYSYYGKNNKSGIDSNPWVMITEACNLVDGLVDFSKYDWNGDGEVNQVYVVYAGYGENYTSDDDPNTIWPHEYSLSEVQESGGSISPMSLDGVTIDTYACSCELVFASGSTMDGIGTACHEFSHCLGFPDLYDCDYKYCPSMSAWDLMDAGSYSGPNNMGEVPTGFSAYERWIGGWLELTELTDPCLVRDLPNLGDSARAYVIYNENERCEAYVLENRQNDRWFKYPDKAHGMLITHIDYDEVVWNNNGVNSVSSHPRVIYVPANNTYGEKIDYGNGEGVYAPTESQLRGQLWPGTTGNTALTNSSTPAAKTYNANSDGKYFMNASIEEIIERDGLISFLFKGGVALQVPSVILSRNNNGVCLSWDAVKDASSYQIKIISTKLDDETLPVVSESMAKFLNTVDANSDISSVLNLYTEVSGWTGSRVYKGTLGAKVGSSKAQGYLCSPKFTVSGDVIVNAVLSAYGSDDPYVKVSLLDESGSAIATQSVKATGVSQQIVLSGGSGKCSVKFVPLKRAYIGAVEILSKEPSGSEKIESTNGTSFVLSDLSDGMNYQFQVRTVGELGYSKWSEVLTSSAGAGIEPLSRIEKNNTRFDLFGRRIKEGNNKIQIINNHLIYEKK